MARKSDDDRFTVNWQAADGYVGRDRPQRFKISVDDFGLDADASDGEIEQAIADAAHEEMLQKVSADVDNLDEAVAWVRARLKEQNT